MFDSAEEITQKLGNCIVIYQNRPFFVYGAKSKTSLHGFFCETNAEATVVLKDPDLDFRNIGEKLGYLNVQTFNRRAYKEATYLMRQPTRRSHQGLHQHNMFISGLKGNPRDPGLAPTGTLLFGPQIFTENAQTFAQMLAGNYPTLREIRSTMTRDQSISSRAFNRNWAIERDHSQIGPFRLMYKTDKVGYTEDIDRLVLSPRFRLMQKDLDDAKRAA